jgi:hypothetical protein
MVFKMRIAGRVTGVIDRLLPRGEWEARVDVLEGGKSPAMGLVEEAQCVLPVFVPGNADEFVQDE